MTAVIEDQRLVEEILDRIGTDLSMIIDREVSFGDVFTERLHARAAGEHVVHISFKLRFEAGANVSWGCLLLPLPEALTLAGYLMMLPDEAVAESRGQQELDVSTKDALLEIGNFISGATDAVIRNWFPEVTVRAGGCQGVRANVRPALPYEEGTELVVGRAPARIPEFDSFEALLLMPVPTGDLEGTS